MLMTLKKNVNDAPKRKTMDQRADDYLKGWGEYRDYDHASPIQLIAMRALKEKLFGVDTQQRVTGGILSFAHSWNFIKKEDQRFAIRRMFYAIGNSWGFSDSYAIKNEAARKLIGMSPFAKEVVAELRNDPNLKGGVHFIPGLDSILKFS